MSEQSVSPTSHGDGHAGPHLLPLKVYYAVWAALLLLTGITVAVSYFDFGEGNLIVAMTIAVIKGLLVAMFFMHLLYENKINAVIFAASVVFLTIFFFLTFADVKSRGAVDSAQGVFIKDFRTKLTEPGEQHHAGGVDAAKTAGGGLPASQLGHASPAPAAH